ncbi:MAG TPA: hypothetical protein IAD26_08335 [Candidatus Limenecus avicola]|uniref:Uncharacterized protein n=1 Tax=Candidatus Limenecus avicola TaxID=2840847 RepID=A0A9D1N1P3_9CLOT|nr:hypothetical protein [Candidatus Limenecus avicola]
MKITNPIMINALKSGKACRIPTMPKHVFLKSDGKRLYIEDWGEDMGCFKPFISALESDDWYIANEEIE